MAAPITIILKWNKTISPLNQDIHLC